MYCDECIIICITVTETLIKQKSSIWDEFDFSMIFDAKYGKSPSICRNFMFHYCVDCIALSLIFFVSTNRKCYRASSPKCHRQFRRHGKRTNFIHWMAKKCYKRLDLPVGVCVEYRPPLPMFIYFTETRNQSGINKLFASIKERSTNLFTLNFLFILQTKYMELVSERFYGIFKIQNNGKNMFICSNVPKKKTFCGWE